MASFACSINDSLSSFTAVTCGACELAAVAGAGFVVDLLALLSFSFRSIARRMRSSSMPPLPPASLLLPRRMCNERNASSGAEESALASPSDSARLCPLLRCVGLLLPLPSL